MTSGPAKPINVLQYESLAREKLSQEVYEFVAGGAEEEVTLRENRAALQRIQLRPRVLVDVSHIDASTTVLGERVALPVLLAPAGGQQLLHPDGELASARAAAAAGTIAVLSTTSSYSIEEVAEAADGPKWFQLYIFSREIAADLVQRAEAAGYAAICLTVDSPRLGRRERPLRDGQPFFPPIVPKNLLGFDLRSIQHNPAVTWHDVDWLRSLTSLPIVLKGIMTAEDACLAVEHGVLAIVVSNHGGRQLDGVPATIDVLPEVVEAVEGRAEVLLDGGVRRGTDVLKALALGARAVLIGRPYLYALAVDGEPGVRHVLGLLSDELETAMALLGCPSLDHLGRGSIRRPSID
jgi:isopentenyl diphosphate isomerase/L-lactate dehydrogenase-like FMN-dependent dehydrogenase